MALSLEQKKAVVSEVSEVAAKAHSAVAAEYIGLSVDDMTALRAKARESSVYLRVVKTLWHAALWKGRNSNVCRNLWWDRWCWLFRKMIQDPLPESFRIFPNRMTNWW